MGWIVVLLILLPFISMKWTKALLLSFMSMYIIISIATLTFPLILQAFVVLILSLYMVNKSEERY